MAELLNADNPPTRVVPDKAVDQLPVVASCGEANELPAKKERAATVAPHLGRPRRSSGDIARSANDGCAIEPSAVNPSDEIHLWDAGTPATLV
jgi:hypothetical protein